MAKFIELRAGEAFRVGPSIVTLEHKTGSRARLRIDSPEEVQQYKTKQPADVRPPITAPALAPRRQEPEPMNTAPPLGMPRK